MQRLGHLDRLGQKIVTGQPGTCYVSVIFHQMIDQTNHVGKVEMNKQQANESVTYDSKLQIMTK